MDEPDVVFRTYEHLRRHGAAGLPLSRLYVDAHPTLLERRPQFTHFQRIFLNLGSQTVHPDLTGVLHDGQTLLALEAKGSQPGTALAQARQYQAGFHLVYLALPGEALTPPLLHDARRDNVGVLGITEHTVEVHHDPTLPLVQELALATIRGQLNLAEQVHARVFELNAPTHYLVVTSVLQPGQQVTEQELMRRLVGEGWPLQAGKVHRHVINGALRLRLLQRDGQTYALSTVGEAVRQILPYPPPQWADIHHRMGGGRRGELIDVDAPAGGTLQLLLLNDPVVQLLCRGLRHLGGSGTLTHLAGACEHLNPALAYVTLLDPRYVQVPDSRWGRVEWSQVPHAALRTTITMQLKRILRHAGILHTTPLRSAPTNPMHDTWTLKIR